MNSKLLSFYFIVLLLYSAQPCNYMMISENAPNIFFAAFPFLLSLLVVAKIHIPFYNKKLLFLYTILTLWNALQYIIYQVFPSPYPYLCLYCGYVGYYVFRDDFFVRYINTVYKFSILSLVVYVLTVVATSTVISFCNKYGIDMTVSRSFILVNVCTNLDSVIPRNAGFCWEPGRFSCFLFFTIAFILLRDGLDFNNRKLLTIILTLITTLSTTGYVALIFILLYWGMVGRKFNPIYIALVLVVVIGIWNLPFMRDKILEFWVNQEDIDMAISQMEWNLQNGNGDTYYSPQRFQALMLQWINFQHMPFLLGASRNTTLHYLNNVMGFRLTLSEGNLGILVRYGLLLGGGMYYSLIKSSYVISYIYNRKMYFMVLGLFLFANFSYIFWETPVFIIVWAWAFFTQREEMAKTL